jgi:hypothetical protein
LQQHKQQPGKHRQQQTMLLLLLPLPPPLLLLLLLEQQVTLLTRLQPHLWVGPQPHLSCCQCRMLPTQQQTWRQQQQHHRACHQLLGQRMVLQLAASARSAC